MFAFELLGGLLDAVEGFEDLEVVVWGQNADSVGEVSVLGIVFRNTVQQLFGFF